MTNAFLNPFPFVLLSDLVEEGYHENNPYHNVIHAADVTQAMHCYLKEQKVSCPFYFLHHLGTDKWASAAWGKGSPRTEPTEIVENFRYPPLVAIVSIMVKCIYLTAHEAKMFGAVLEVSLSQVGAKIA